MLRREARTTAAECAELEREGREAADAAESARGTERLEAERCQAEKRAAERREGQYRNALHRRLGAIRSDRREQLVLDVVAAAGLERLGVYGWHLRCRTCGAKWDPFENAFAVPFGFALEASEIRGKLTWWRCVNGCNRTATRRVGRCGRSAAERRLVAVTAQARLKGVTSRPGSRAPRTHSPRCARRFVRGIDPRDRASVRRHRNGGSTPSTPEVTR